MENANAAILDAVRKAMAPIRVAVGVAMVDPERLTSAERLQYEGYRRREATGEAILALSRQGMAIKKIARTTEHCCNLVRNVLRGAIRATQPRLRTYRTDRVIGVTLRVG